MKAGSLAIILLLAIISPTVSFAENAQNLPQITSPQDIFYNTAQKILENPNDMDALFNHAKAAAQIGKPEEAIIAYKKMLVINPKLGRVKLELGNLYAQSGNMDLARPLFEDVLADNPPPQIKEQVAAMLSTQSKKPSEPQQTPMPAPAATEETLAEFDAQIKENPNNLDAQFNYASIASQLGKVKEAENAYLSMLKINPQLHRVKLDLALLYMRAGKFKQSKTLFEQVLATNPPKEVQQNINLMLANVNNALKTDIFSGSVSIGYNHDSNANSASSSGQITYSNISIPLDSTSSSQADGQIVQTASLSHLHKFDIDSDFWGASLTTTGVFYRTSQLNINSLDLILYSIKTGPTIDLKKLKMQVGMSYNLSYITLASVDYMRSPSYDFTIKYAPLANLILDYDLTIEDRKFSNSVNSPDNVAHNGTAYQHKIGVTYAVTQKDIVNTTATWRNESARSDYLGLDQINLTTSYIRVLPYNMSLNSSVGYKKTDYNDVDSSISTTKVRSDMETTMGFTLSKQLPKNINLSIGYQYKNAKSNLENYTYADHRFMSSMGWSF
jgi:tetratricopeptide (TPR) repeat protein